MKKLLGLLIVVGAVTASASVLHVEPKDEITNLGSGTKIKILKTVNFKPNSEKTVIGKKYSSILSIKEANCWLITNKSNADRSLSFGSELEISQFVRSETYYNPGWIESYEYKANVTNFKSIFEIKCEIKIERHSGVVMSLGFLQDFILSDSAEVILGKTVEIQ